MHQFAIRLRFNTLSNDRNTLPKSIFDRLPHQQGLETREFKPPSGALGRIRKDHRTGLIRVDWADMSSFQERQKFATETSRGPAVASFKGTIPEASTGSVALAEGIIHIYRTSSHGGISEPVEDGTVLAVLAVPSWMASADFLTFISGATETLVHLRIIRDSSPNRAMALLKFRTKQDAAEFVEEFNGKPFNTMESETCHVARISSIKIETPDLATGYFSDMPPGSTEIPTCPVCLERMDLGITGLVTIPCSHTFHCQCLSKWGDSRCPVCRYSQKALQQSIHTSASGSARARASSIHMASNAATITSCSDCSTTTNLWICLICGNMGCGRYGRAHAQAHYQLTTHVYALELETQRVWDYAGDAYVHRLIQNRADGKLVELPSASISSTTMGGERGLGPGPADTMAAEKVEAIGIEYSYLLTSQLDSQRAYYEEQTAELRDKLSEAQVRLERAAREAERHRAEHEASETRIKAETEARAAQIRKEREKAEKRAEKAIELARKFEKELREEKMVNEGLLKNLAVYRERSEGVEEERKKLMDKMADLEDQLRDVMFFLETKDKIEKGEGVGAELAGGSLEVSIPAPPTSSNGKKKRKK